MPLLQVALSLIVVGVLVWLSEFVSSKGAAIKENVFVRPGDACSELAIVAAIIPFRDTEENCAEVHSYWPAVSPHCASYKLGKV